MLITTHASPSSAAVRRAHTLAARCGLQVVDRRGTLEEMAADAGVAPIYVVGRQHEALWSSGIALHVHEGMLGLKARLGVQHPLVRAVLHGGPCCQIVDATLGLAGDALHLASVLDVAVDGIEASPVVMSLVEEALPRLAAGTEPARTAAGRITVQLGDAHDVLATMGSGSTDVVLVDPMFPAQRPAAPGFELLRAVAYPCPDPSRLIDEARRVARSHVVLKYPKRPEIPPCDARIDGKALRYLLYEAAGARAAATSSSWPADR